MLLLCGMILSSISLELVSGQIDNSNSRIQESPLKQFKSGVKAQDVKCQTNYFILIIKSENGSPACVKPNTAQKLVELGWAMYISKLVHQMASTNANVPFGIIALIVYSPPDLCLKTSCPPNNFYLKINANSTAYLIGYDICDDNSCTEKNDLSILLPVQDVLRPDFKLIPLSENLQWKYGGNVHIQVKVSSTSDNKTATMIDLGNSTIVS